MENQNMFFVSYIKTGLWIIYFLLLINSTGFGQRNYSGGLVLSKADSIIASSISELKLPDSYRYGERAVLPWVLNNATLPYFRPVFSQDGACCGQAAGVGYNFTYEINCARGTEAVYFENQYPTHFAWDFMNGGYGWQGVSYFHSFDLIKACGSPSVATYGGMAYGGDQRWMSGYSNYYSAMQNRIKEVYFIDVKTSDGLTTLKHWLNDHLDGSEVGGVANFYSATPWNLKVLPDGTPEEGKSVIVDWAPVATHAMTIVGYNDSVRYDVNFDGKYTNNIDINNDDVVDMKDWEIGALLFVNSYSDYWADSGFCYMLYRSLACDYGDGGIWNGEVHVLTVEEQYEPQLTVRVKLKHNSREKIKLTVGVSPDTLVLSPIFSMDFPMMNFQGGDQPLQGLEGSDTLNPRMMELELDVTPLLAYVESNKSARYFLQVIENDAYNDGVGEVLYFSLIDRSGEETEIICNKTPSPIVNNNITTLSIVSAVSFNKPEIITEELPAFSTGENYSHTMEAAGGQLPYQWELLFPYYVNVIQDDFPEVLGEELIFEDQDVGHFNFDLEFPFLFYGDSISRVTVALDGFVSFEDEEYAYPYYFGESTMLTERRVIAPFMANLWLDENNEDNGVWVENTPEYFSVIWKASCVYHNTIIEGDFKFALRLYPDGSIETYYGDFYIPAHLMWLSGVSKGDKTNYTINSFIRNQQDPSGSAFEYYTSPLPDNVEITTEGELSASGTDEGIIYELTTQLIDEKHLVDRKTFQLSSGLTYQFEIESGNDARIDFSETASLNITVRNISNVTIDNIEFQSTLEDENINVLSNSAYFGSLSPGETRLIDSAVVFEVAESISDKYNFKLTNKLFNQESSWSSDVMLTAHALKFIVNEIIVTNDNNGILEPGETADLKIVVQNLGHSSGNDFDFKFISNSDYLIINTPLQHIDFFPAGGKDTIVFNVRTRDWTPAGFEVQNVLEILSDDEIIQLIQTPMKIGKVPVLVINLVEGMESANIFSAIFDSLRLRYDLVDMFPDNLKEYNAVFVCLGDLFNYHELSWFEADKLNDFLMDGGNIYMEGMRTWHEDIQLPLHSKFGFDKVTNGNYFEIDHVYGVDGEITEGIIMDYGGSLPFNNHYLKARGLAFPFLRTSHNDSACAIANDTLNYKTIGSSLLFGAMASPDSSFVTIEYVNKIIEFFEIVIQFEDVKENYLEESLLHFELFPNPFTKHLSMQFFGSGAKNASFEIFDINGRLIKSQSLAYIELGDSIEMSWDGSDENGQYQSPGIYIVKYIAGKQSASRKVILR